MRVEFSERSGAFVVSIFEKPNDASGRGHVARENLLD